MAGSSYGGKQTIEKYETSQHCGDGNKQQGFGDEVSTRAEQQKGTLSCDTWRDKTPFTIYACCLGFILQGKQHVSEVIRSCKANRGAST